MKVSPKTITLKDGRTVILRSPEPVHAESLLKHLRIARTESYKNLNQSAAYLDNITVDDEAKILADFESSTGKFMLVALFEDKVIGVMGFVAAKMEFTKHSGSIGMMIQLPFCNCGLGTAMMQYVLASGKAFGFHRADLTVRTYNAPGIALYEKAGFQRIGLLKDIARIDGEYVDEYAYQIILD